MKRRHFIALLGGAAALSARRARAQQATKTPRVGFLSQSARTPMGEPFQAGLREAGFDGQSVIMEWRFAAGDLNKLAPLAAELVHADVDVIVTTATPAAKAAQSATRTIPIVAIDPGDPVQTGLVASLAQPGGNITAESSIAPDLQAKRLELLKEVAPNISHVAILSNVGIPVAEVALQELRLAANTLKVDVQPVEVSGPQDFANAFATITNQRFDALLVFPDPLTFSNARSIVELASKNRVAAMFGAREFVDIGGLMSYGPNYPNMYRRAGVYVGRILKGTKPANLPVEQPTGFEFILNAKAAHGLGLTVPPSLLATADDVIE
jgi:putative tryptophan/tyrosine transport system substrate-binding protein